MKPMVAGIAAILLLTACGGAPQASGPSRCLDVPAEMLQTIVGGASGAAMKPVKGAAVKSNDLKNAYMIAMRFSAPGGGDETGVWTSDSLKPGGGLIMSVDSYAAAFTHWPDAGKSAFKITQETDGVEAAKACLG